MKKIFVFLGIIAAVTMAAPRKTQFKKHVEYNYYFYAVDPVWESFSYAKGLTQKSFKKRSTISCDLTVDIGRFLIKNDGDCDFYDVSFHDSGFFLGKIFDPDTIKSGNYYSHFNESSSFINYLYISAMNARYTISDYWDPELGVIDEDDMPKGIRCKKSEVFMVTRYRTKKIGKSHYRLAEEFSDEYNPNAVCVEIETPPQGYYFVTGAFIEPLPNAKTMVGRKNDEGWECKAGYLLGYGDRCFKNCAENSYFDFHSETCKSIPANAYKAGAYSWDCNEDYFKKDDLCQSIPANAHKTGFDKWECNEEFFKEENRCQSIPANAHKTGFDKWECNEGFFKKNDLCEKIPDCGNFSYFDIKKEYCESCNANEVFRENSCESIPAHSTKISPTEWKCNAGYFEKYGGGYFLGCFLDINCTQNSYYDDYSETCKSIPANAHKTGLDNWECNDGYFRKANRCAKILDCGKSSYFDFTSGSCKNIPDHSTKISPTEWKCNDEYALENGSCVVRGKNRSENFYYDYDSGTYQSIPANAHRVWFDEWDCNEGYSLEGNECINHISLDLLAGFSASLNFGAKTFEFDSRFILGGEILNSDLSKNKQISASLYGLLGLNVAENNYDREGNFSSDARAENIALTIGGGLGLRFYHVALDFATFAFTPPLGEDSELAGLDIRKNKYGMSFTAGYYFSEFFEFFGQVRSNYLQKISSGYRQTQYGSAIGGIGIAFLW